jgi:tetratricopeptide (TPR) repeat protein
MNNIAEVLSHQGRYEQAEEMDQQALRLMVTVLGTWHPSTLTSMNNLALVLSHQDKCEPAEEMHRQALRLCETVLGKEHPDTLTSVNILAQTWISQDRGVEAIALMKEFFTDDQDMACKASEHTPSA